MTPIPTAVFLVRSCAKQLTSAREGSILPAMETDTYKAATLTLTTRLLARLDAAARADARTRSAMARRLLDGALAEAETQDRNTTNGK